MALSREQCDQTWNIFFSAPLCFIYSLGRNSFRLGEKWFIQKVWVLNFSATALKSKQKNGQFHNLSMLDLWNEQNFSICTFKKGWIILLLVNLVQNKRVTRLIFCKEFGGVKRNFSTGKSLCGIDTYSKNPGLCLWSMWGPNWIWAWMPPNSQALSNDTGWEPFRISSRAWKTKQTFVNRVKVKETKPKKPYFMASGYYQ